MRVGVYIDGFNAYHAIDALGIPRLKWLDYMSLSQALAGDGEVERVVFYTAISPWSPAKRARHTNYLAALRVTGVRVVESIFTRPRKWCEKQQLHCRNYEEKQTDVAIATDVLTDCFQNRVDKIMLVTADSDQIPLVSRVRRLFPDKTVVLVAPPGRLSQARALGEACSGVTELMPKQLGKHLLPDEVHKPNGKIAARIPAEYLAPAKASESDIQPALDI